MTPKRALPAAIGLLLAAWPAAGMTPRSAPDCKSDLPLVLNAAVAPSGRFGLREVGRLAEKLFTALYERQGVCAGSRPLQVNLAVANEYHALRWLEEGSGGVDVAVVSDLSLYLLQREEIELLEIDLAAAGHPDLAEAILPRWRQKIEVETVGSSGNARDPATELKDFRHWLWSGLPDDPSVLASVHREGEDRCPAVDEASDPGVRLTLPSHLSTVGFVDTVAETRGWLTERTAQIEAWSGLGADRLAAAAEACFWRRFFDHICFSLVEFRIDGSAADRSRAAGDACTRRWRSEAGAETRPRRLVEVRVSRATGGGPAGGAEGTGPPAAEASASRDHLVIRRAQAETIFGAGTARDAAAESSSPPIFTEAVAELPDGIAELIEAAAAPRGFDEPVRPEHFRSFAGPTPGLGIRTFAFTPREAIELLDIHQEFSDRRQLALVLPGGGVKAAFQSRILEKLYGEGLLRNALHGSNGRSSPEAVLVDSVVGTSGGALLGFFVARLGPEGPWQLSDVLWKRVATSGGREEYLDAFDIFGWTDLPRYLSLLAIYAVFALVLAFFSLRYQGWLAPPRDPARAGAAVPSWRPALLGLLAGVLGLTPLLVRWANGGASIEHVPEFEGLLYSILVLVAIFADQTLIHTESADESRDGREAQGRAGERPVWSPPRALLAVGGFLVAAPLLVQLAAAAAPETAIRGWAARLERPTTGWEAYLLVGVVAAGLILSAVKRRRGVRGVLSDLGLFAAVFAGGTTVAWFALRAVSKESLDKMDDVPLLLVALAMSLFLLLLTRLAAGKPGQPRLGFLRGHAWVENRLAWIRSSRIVRVGATILAPVLACVIILDLTRPEAATFVEPSWTTALTAASKLDTPRGGLFVALGAVLVAMGGVLWLHHRPNRYRLDRPKEFVDGVVFVILGLTLVVYGALYLVVWGITRLDRSGRFDDSPLFQRVAELSMFELTPAFWIGLGTLSALGALGIVLLARKGERRGWKVGRWLKARLVWLSSLHPNGHLVSRRFVRLGLFGFGGLLWWNFVLAPALYGNRTALDYLTEVDARFGQAYGDAHRAPGGSAGAGADPGSSYRLTAQFLAPANSLETNGTRFILAIPADGTCPRVQSSPGVLWRRFRVVDGSTTRRGADDCKDIRLSDAKQLDELRDFVFASGSPFPAFPPKRAGSDEDREALVDGGYSNLVPLEAAANLAAVQALIVHSSHPVTPAGEPGIFATLAGPLVDNVPRLFGFLYQRSQQLDRRSRSSLFVVSLAPPYRPDWPLLTDFRRSTVKKMIGEADDAFDRRIGMVESWGPPFFQFNVTVPSQRSQRAE